LHPDGSPVTGSQLERSGDELNTEILLGGYAIGVDKSMALARVANHQVWPIEGVSVGKVQWPAPPSFLCRQERDFGLHYRDHHFVHLTLGR
jgi:hypothetical protein